MSKKVVIPMRFRSIQSALVQGKYEPLPLVVIPMRFRSIQSDEGEVGTWDIYMPSRNPYEIQVNTKVGGL